jgi:hypothetical protein
MPGRIRPLMSDAPDPLDPLLDRWQESANPSPHLAAEVWRRIAVSESAVESHGRPAVGFWTWLRRPPAPAWGLIACALVGIFLVEMRMVRRERQHSALLARSYLQLIDPLLKDGAVASGPQPFDPDALAGELAWIKSELHLSDAQFARIKELHQASSPRLRALAAQVDRMRAEFIGFENTRRTADRIDFLEFARFVELRRDIDRQCLESTRRLVLAAADEMTPGQREHYLGIVAPAKPLDRLPN